MCFDWLNASLIRAIRVVMNLSFGMLSSIGGYLYRYRVNWIFPQFTFVHPCDLNRYYVFQHQYPISCLPTFINNNQQLRGKSIPHVLANSCICNWLSSIAQSVCQWASSLLAIWCQQRKTTCLDLNIACLCQSIEINKRKYVHRQSQVRKPTGSVSSRLNACWS